MTATSFPPHARRSAETWAAARADFELGASIRIVAERHGLNIRTVSRHAQAEGWTRPGVSAREIYVTTLKDRDYQPAAIDEMANVAVDLQHDEERLLLRPDTLGLCRFAFQRAAESAAVSGPTEALAWMRLAQATARLRQGVNVDVRPIAESDFRRAAAIHREEQDAVRHALQDSPAEDDQVSESVPRFSTDTDTSA